MTARWLRHPARSVLDWVGGLVVDHVFAHEEQLRRIAAHNERRGQRTPGRHRAPKPLLALLRRLNRIPRGKLGGLFLAAVGTVTLAVAGLATGGDRVTPASLAVGRSPVALADDPGRRGGPMDYAPAQPPVIVAAGEPVWDPSKGPVIVDGEPLPPVSRSARPAPAAPPPPPKPVVGAPPVAAAPQPEPPANEPVVPVIVPLPITDEESPADPEPVPDPQPEPADPMAPEPVGEQPIQEPTP